MKTASVLNCGLSLLTVLCAMHGAGATVSAAEKRPNILFIVSDDTGYGDLGPYGGGEGRGMPTPNIDRLASGGMQFYSFYAQPSCTPGRAAMQTGPQRHDHRGLSRSGRGLAQGGMDARLGAEVGRLQDVFHRQMAPG
ncbi:MAG TPA: sulfatase-like hydrolase/transferase [Pirellulales bacterium]|jgi:arylsulfatase